jgi:hypothetical protein
LRIDIDIIPRLGQVHSVLVWDEKSIVIKDHFFGQTIVGQSYIAANRIPEKITTTTEAGFEKAILIFGKDDLQVTPGKIVSGLDVFAGAFFMLTRWEESLGLYEDLHGRFPAAQSVVVKSGFILRPIVDEYVASLKSWLKQLGYPVPETKDSFKIVPTCDVDMPYFWLKKPGWKVMLSQWLANKNFSTIKQTRAKIKAVEAGVEQDPYDQFDYMMSLAEKAGLSFDFNMLVGGISKYEGYYSVTDPRIQNLMKSFIGQESSYRFASELQFFSWTAS